jgi:hypothetical protein
MSVATRHGITQRRPNIFEDSLAGLSKLLIILLDAVSLVARTLASSLWWSIH